MRWFAGTSGAGDTLRPAGAREVWGGPDGLWVVGEWADHEVRVVRRGSVALAVLGDCRATDSELDVGLAVARGGGVRHLTCWPGSYHVVLRLGTRTIVLGDVAGVRPVFHTRHGDGVVYGSHALPLADLGRGGLDAGHAAARLACPDVPEVMHARSAFAGVARLEPGHILELAAGRAQARPYERHDAPLDFHTAAGELREALVASVGRRVGTAATPGSDLSGGRDSTVLALLAARAAPRGVVAVTWDDPNVPEDTEPARRIAVEIARMRHLLVPATDGYLPYSGLADAFTGDGAPVTDGPAACLATATRVLGQMGAARAAGVDVHLTGYGGDAVLGTPPAFLGDLAAEHKIVAAVRHARRWARTSGRSTGELTAAARRLARTPLHAAVADLAAAVAAGRATPDGIDTVLAWCAPAPGLTWLTRDARESLGASLRALSGELADGASPFPVAGPGDRAAWVAVHRSAERQRVQQQLAEFTGVRACAPFLDNQVLRPAMALPVRSRERGDNARTLLNEAVDGLIPRSTMSLVGKSDYSATELRGLRRNAAALRELFDGSLLGGVGVVDDDEVRRSIDSYVMSVKTGLAVPLGAFADLVSTEVWLRSVQAAPVHAWIGAEGEATGTPANVAAVA